MNNEQKKNTVANIVDAMIGISGDKKMDIINCQLCYWFRADIALGMTIAKGLKIDVDENMMKN